MMTQTLEKKKKRINNDIDWNEVDITAVLTILGTMITFLVTVQLIVGW